MRNWRGALQSKGMRNVVLGIVALDVAGAYAVHVKLNQPVSVDLELDQPAAVVAEADIGLPPVQATTTRQFALAEAPALPPAIRLEPIDVIPDAPETPMADAQAAEPEVAAAPVEPKRTSVRLAAWAPSPSRVSTRPSAEFSAAFSATDAIPVDTADAPPSDGDAAPAAHPVGQAPQPSARIAALTANVTVRLLPLTELPAPVADVQTGSGGPQVDSPRSVSIPGPDFGTGSSQPDAGKPASAPLPEAQAPLGVGGA